MGDWTPINCRREPSLCENRTWLLRVWRSMPGYRRADQKDGCHTPTRALAHLCGGARLPSGCRGTEIASGLNDERPKLTKLLTNPQMGVIVVEHRDRLTRFGYGYIATLLEPRAAGRGASFLPILVMAWSMILWRSSRAWRHVSMDAATVNAGRSRLRHALNMSCKCMTAEARSVRTPDGPAPTRPNWT